MIKHLLSLAVTLLVSVPVLLAQTFEFQYHGESLPDGATVTIEAEENDFGDLACATNPISDPNNGLILKLLSGNITQGSAIMTVIENTMLSEKILWCMGSACSSFGGNTTLTKNFMIENGACQVEFDAEDIMASGRLIATLTATIGGETHMVNIKFVYEDTSDPSNDAALEFRYHGAALPDGATVTIQAEEDDFGDLTCATNPSSDPANGLVLKVLSGNYTRVIAAININENTLLSERVTWCMGGSCMFFGNKTTLIKDFTIEDGGSNVMFDSEEIQSEGHLYATLIASIGGVSRTVKIKFTNGEQDDPVHGDVNGDGNVTAADVTALYDFMLSNDSSNIVYGDQNGDGEITSADVTAVYDVLLGN